MTPLFLFFLRAGSVSLNVLTVTVCFVLRDLVSRSRACDVPSIRAQVSCHHYVRTVQLDTVFFFVFASWQLFCETAWQRCELLQEWRTSHFFFFSVQKFYLLLSTSSNTVTLFAPRG